MKNFTRLLFTGVLILMFGGNIAAQENPQFTTVVGKLVRTTPKLADIDLNSMYGEPLVKRRNENGIIGLTKDKYANPNKGKFASKFLNDMGLQVPSSSPTGVTAAANIIQNFDGLTAAGFAPSDNNMSVGPNHVIQIINHSSGSQFKIWNKAGVQVQGPTTLSSVTGIAGAGDPVVMYDQIADRWILTEFAGASINILVWAVSTTPDPTGPYKIYSYTFPYSADYPHYSVWHNAYYGITHDFQPGYVGSSIYAFDRAAMLAGAPTATVVSFRFAGAFANRSFTNLPVHQEGPALSNQSGLFTFFQDDTDTGDPLDVDSIFTFTYTPNFTTPANSVIGPMASVVAAPFNSTLCGVAACITQPAGGQAIRGIEGQILHKVGYRNFGGYESMVANFTTNAGAGIGGIRWWELRRTGGAGAWSMYQQGTYAPADGNHRFMGSIAQNAVGDIGLIFNVTGPGTPATFPSFRLTGRTTCDPLGQMTIPETSIMEGTVLNGTNRYGDYNALNTDPSSNNFWGTGQYNATGFGTFGNWATRMVNFSISGGAATISNQPANAIVCAGTSASFSVTAVGGGTLSYQWQVSTDNGATWTNVTGATGATYAFTAVAGDNGKRFRCIVSSSACTLTGTSNAATLTITTLSQGGTMAASSANACAGPNSTTLTLSGHIGNIIRWESSIDNGVTWTNIANTTTTLTVTNITQTTLYRAFVQSSGCTAAYSTTATVTFVSAGVGALTISSDNGIVLCSGDPTKLTALTAPTPGMVSVSSGLISVAIPDNSAAGIGTNLTLAGVPATATGTNARVNFNITHTWDSDLRIFIKSPNNQVLNLVNGRGGSGDNFTNTVISSASANSLAAGVAPFTGTFMADGSLAALAPIGFTPTATTFTPLINTAGQLNGIWSLGARDGAAGDAGIITTWGLSLDYAVPAGAPAGATYVWTPAAGLNATTGNPVAASPAVTTTYTVVATNGSGCTGTANITITVNQRPAVTTQPSNVAVCTGTSATFTVAATGTGISYQWQESTNGGTTWTGLTNGTPYAGVTTAALTVNPVTAAMNNNRYRCVISGTCTPAANSNGAVLTVKALPNVVVTPASGCGGVAGINGLQLSTGSAAPPIPGTLTVNSGTISVAVPDNTANGASHTLNIAGIPANATIVNARVTLNMTHTWNGDMLFNLKAPNNTVLALDKYLTGTGGAGATTGFVNTVISSAGITALSAGTGTYTGTFKPDLINGTITGTTVQNPAGFVSTASSFADLYATPNGPWILAMADGGNGDVGTLTGWSITIDYTTPGGTGSPLTYTWSPAAGLYNNATATAGYILGTQTPTVYAAPTVFTTYTVTGTDATTGCSNTATALINYTPPAPTVTPNPVAMCLGDVPVKLKSSSSTSTTACFNSGTISVAIPDNTANGVSSNLTVSGVPANATIASVTVRLTMPHTWVGDMIFNLKAPNGNILSLDKYLSGTGGAGATAGFTNTVISSAGAAALSSGSSPYTGTFRADALLTVPFPFSDPAGFAANVTNWPGLYATPNGTWTLAMADGGPADLGTLTNWEICINYVVGVPSAPAVWTPAAGLFSNAAGTTAYVAGTAVDSVWASPTTIGINPYQVTVNSLPPPAVTPATNFATGNGQALVTFNIRNNNAYPVTLSSISSAFLATGSSTNTAFMKTSAINGVPGAISAANGWNQIGTSTVTVGTALSITPAVTGMSVAIPAGATYGIAIQGLAGAAGNISYSTLAAGVSTFTAGGCSIITGTGIGFGGVAAPGAPTFTPRGFIGSVSFLPGAVAACTSPARTVEVTVNQPISITAQPVNAVACTDKATSFTVAASGTTPTYQWQVSTNTGNTFTNVANGGVYTGATTATLTITAPPTTMSGYIYRCNVSGAAPCSTVASAQRLLTVNPLPTVTIAASPYRALFPGLTTTLFSTVTPAAATYTWLRNGTAVGGTGASSLLVNVDGLGTYTLRVTDVNGCVNTSNTVLLTDSASGKVFIYPNPNSGQFQVRYYSALNNTGLPRGINVYDARGKRIVTSTYSISAPYARMDVDLRNHGTGVYTIEVVDVNGNRLAVGRAEVLR